MSFLIYLMILPIILTFHLKDGVSITDFLSEKKLREKIDLRICGANSQVDASIFPKQKAYILSRLIEKYWHRPIFAEPYGTTIVSAEPFHYPVRNGKEWDKFAPDTSIGNTTR